MKEGPVDEIMELGKHKGEFVSRLNNGALEWFLEQDWFADRYSFMEEVFTEELDWRKAFNMPVGPIQKTYRPRSHIND